MEASPARLKLWRLSSIIQIVYLTLSELIQIIRRACDAFELSKGALMKIFSIFTIVCGLIVALIGFLWIDFYGLPWLVQCFALGGVICLGGVGIQLALRQLTRLENIESLLKKQLNKESTAEEIVDQLRREGLINTKQSLTDAEIEEMVGGR